MAAHLHGSLRLGMQQALLSERMASAAPLQLQSRSSPGRMARHDVSASSQSVSRKSVAVRATGTPIFGAVKDDLHQTDNLTVGDFMTTTLVTVTPSTTIEHALELLVEYRITGFPVVDEEQNLVGVVSDIDLLAIDALLGRDPEQSAGLFPAPDKSWKAFKEIQKLLLKTKGKLVGDVMTPHPVTVRASTNLDEAARFLLGTQFRRLPVLDGQGKLVGLLTRGNVVKAALEMRKPTGEK